MSKLKLGCGFAKRAGFLNADSFTASNPDVLQNTMYCPHAFERNGETRQEERRVLGNEHWDIVKTMQFQLKLFTVCSNSS